MADEPVTPTRDTPAGVEQTFDDDGEQGMARDLGGEQQDDRLAMVEDDLASMKAELAELRQLADANDDAINELRSRLAAIDRAAPTAARRESGSGHRAVS